MSEDIRDTHVQNVNRNALKVAIECERARACERTLERSGHKCNKENGIEKERKHDKDDNQKIQRKNKQKIGKVNSIAVAILAATAISFRFKLLQMYTHKWKESIESEETSNRDEEKRTKNGIDRWKRQTYFRAFAFKHTHTQHLVIKSVLSK